MTESTISNEAYCKINLHAMKYPFSCVGGYLIGTPTPSSSGNGQWSHVEITDAVPIYHNIPLGPIFEIGGSIVEADLKSPNVIVGFYWAPEELPTTSSAVVPSSSSGMGIDAKPIYVAKVASVIRSNSGGCVLMNVRNEMLDKEDVLGVEARMHDDSKCVVKSIESASSLQKTIEGLLAAGRERLLIDLEDHMDSPGGEKDFRNQNLLKK